MENSATAKVLHAADPRNNATVSASAGTGKTWMLVTRMVRLLLDGARPDGLLAITFTRKAAAEMQTRLRERLLMFASLDAAGIRTALGQIGIDATPEQITTARGLYEALLRAPHPPRTTTFHAFCQDVLRRFPLEADVAPGFELVETTRALEREALAALYAEATAAPDNRYGAALETLFDLLGGANTETALYDILAHRSDWWAYTADAHDPVAYAIDRARRLLNVDYTQDPAAQFVAARHAELVEFARLLEKHVTIKNAAHAALLVAALNQDRSAADKFASITTVFLTQELKPLKRKSSKAQVTSLGVDDDARFIAMHEQISAHMLEVLDALRARKTLEQTRAWLCAGQRLIEHFQRIKDERRVLDFNDLEWRTYALLNRSDNAHWVQYKLDQRIEHFLIDEFQDTNPIQWRMLLPLLEEFAAGETSRSRSVFLVGDAKQSIYRFRRADARLFSAAQDWLGARVGAATYSLDESRRSAQAVIDCVNYVFDTDEARALWGAFPRHTAHLASMWGRVEMLPLIDDDPARANVIERSALRHPLREPRIVAENMRHETEGLLIAQRIKALIDAPTLIGEAPFARPLRYGDVMILFRNRTHVHAYESALRRAGIPYAGADRGTLLESLEVRDMEALLQTLVAPFNNLALAGVLRGPLFNCTDADLQLLARFNDGTWMERLAAASQLDENHALRYAQHALTRWRIAAERLPVHDLLDRIYFEGRVLERYAAAFPAHLRTRVRANLTRFIELALEIDSGRYPSLTHFLYQLRDARRSGKEAPDEGAASAAGECVRLLTIHAAKGLEAPVVFLADAASPPRNARGLSTLIDWPPEAKRPEHFLLVGKKADQDAFCRNALAADARAEQREELNLLYVALTRARQILFVSGSAPGRGAEPGWYGLIESRLRAALGDGEPLVIESGIFPTKIQQEQASSRAPLVPTIGLSQRIETIANRREISPSQSAGALAIDVASDDDAQQRGIAIHRMLDLLTRVDAAGREEIQRTVAHECAPQYDDSEFGQWWREADAVLAHGPFRYLFDPTQYQRALNEAPLIYEHQGRIVHGIADRIVVTPDTVFVIDYKTHRSARVETLGTFVAAYARQLNLYAEAARRIWPTRAIRPMLLFTASRVAAEVPRRVDLQIGDADPTS